LSLSLISLLFHLSKTDRPLLFPGPDTT
jgi:hypothetical protein